VGENLNIHGLALLLKENINSSTDELPVWDADGNTTKRVAVDNLPISHLQLNNKPEITVGDTGYATIAAAVTAIGATDVTLVIPSNLVPPNSIPANINLKFTKGGMLDTTGFPSAHPTAMAASGSVTEITKASHGLVNGDVVMFTGITQSKDNGDGSAEWEWMNLNYRPLTVTKTGDNTFTIPFTSTSYVAYNASVDAGKYSKTCNIEGTVEAGLYKIFNCNSSAIVLGTIDAGDMVSKKQITLYPEWFGAVGDADSTYGTGTDDTTAMFYTRDCSYVGAYQPKSLIILSAIYRMTDTWAFNCFNSASFYASLNVIGLDRRNTGIKSEINGYPAIESFGMQNVVLDNFSVWGLANYKPSKPTTAVPSVALLYGRSLESRNSHKNVYSNLNVYGYFQWGAIMGINGEETIIRYPRIETRTPDTSINHYSFTFANCISKNTFPSIVPKYAQIGYYVSDSAVGNMITDPQIACEGKVGDCIFYAEESFIIRGGYSDQGDGTDSTRDVIRCVNCGIAVYDHGNETTVRHAFIGITSTTPDGNGQGKKVLCKNSGGVGNYPTLVTDSNTSILCSDIEASSGVSIGKYLYQSLIRFIGTSASPYLYIGGTGNYKGFGNTVIGNQGLLSNNMTGLGDLFVNSTFIKIAGPLALESPNLSDPTQIGLTINNRRLHWDETDTINAGSYKLGSFLFNFSPKSNTYPQYLGRLCTSSGTYGTLNSGNTIASGTSGTPYLWVNSYSGLYEGCVVDVAGLYGHFYVIRCWEGGISLSPKTFTGSGLNDATFSGTPTETGHTYQVTIDGDGSPNTFKWRIGTGSWTTGVAMTGSAQLLDEGVYVTFGAITGHTLTDDSQANSGYKLTMEGNLDSTVNKAAASFSEPTFQMIYKDGYMNSVTDTGSGTVAFDFNNGFFQYCSIGASGRTITLANPQVGRTFKLKLLNGFGGSNSVTFSPVPKWPGGTGPTLTSTQNHWDMIYLEWDGTQYIGRFDSNYN
jgi:hypothetical protein